MANYRIVKYCRLCKGRFIVEKKDSRINYCVKCTEKMQKEQENKDKDEEED